MYAVDLDPHSFPPSSSVLAALSSPLTPPSPILIASEFTSCFSGDIPIFLASSPTVDSLQSLDFDRRASLGVTARDSVDTIGTFGPKYGIRDHESECLAPLRRISSTSTSSECFAHLDISLKRFSDGPSAPSFIPVHYTADKVSDDFFREGLADLGPQGVSAEIPVYQRSEPSPVFPSTPLSPMLSTFSMPTSTLPSPSLSIRSALACPPSPWHVPAARPDMSQFFGDIDTLRKTAQDISNTNSSRRLAQNLASSDPSASPSTPCLPVLDRHLAMAPPAYCLPPDLSWLEDVVVQLLIDQEGFRSIFPSFRFARCCRSLDRHQPGIIGGVAEFIPLKRQTFYFHWAPFDSLPLLRRVTVDNRASRDYISRQASLSLKSNGVYTVHGTEPASYFRDESNANQQPGKLKWKFDYVVDDRRDTVGRIMHGEKSFTPLMFACSPLLLHPFQGKRVKLMQIVKKSVATKLIAEKVEPPLPPFVSSLPAQENFKAQDNRAWNLHRRVQSNALEHRRMESGSSVRYNNPNRALQIGECVADVPFVPRVGRRRRASSAGEGSRRVLDGAQSGSSPQTTTPIVSARHIIPRSQLAKLMTDMENTPPSRSYLASSGLQALNPPPRRLPTHA